MLKRLDLKAQKICVSGTPNNKAWKRRILSAEGKTTTKVVLSTTLLIKGGGWSTQEDVANGRGIPVIDEEQGELLLKQGFIEIEVADEGTHSLDELIGELRSALDGPPSSDTWNVIIDQIDRCSPEQLEPLVQYLTPILSAWTISPDARWSPSQQPLPPREWLEALPYGELRVTPHHWIAAMSSGESSPAYGLLRHLHLDEMKLKATTTSKVLGLTHLTNLHTFDLGGRNTYAPTIWKKIAEFPSCTKLTHFGMGEFRSKHIKILPELHDWHPFETLTINYYFSKYDDDALVEFLSSPACAGVKTLRMLDSPEDIIDLLNEHDTMLPALECVTIKDNGFIASLLTRFHRFERPVTRALAECDIYMYEREKLVEAFAKAYPHIHTLDISEVRLQGSPVSDRGDADADEDTLTNAQRNARRFHTNLLDLFPGSVLAKSLEAIILGRWWSEELTGAIEAHGTRVLG